MIGRHACGAVWHQIASRTGHCCGCHRTFASEEVFDRHRVQGVCLDPATLMCGDGITPRFETFIDRAGGEVWRSAKRMTDASRAALRAKDALKAKAKRDAA